MTSYSVVSFEPYLQYTELQSDLFVVCAMP